MGDDKNIAASSMYGHKIKKKKRFITLHKQEKKEMPFGYKLDGKNTTNLRGHWKAPRWSK